MSSDYKKFLLPIEVQIAYMNANSVLCTDIMEHLTRDTCHHLAEVHHQFPTKTMVNIQFALA